MAKFAPTCPPQILAGLKADKMLGVYHLLLAHDVVKRAKEYDDVFRGGDYIIVLDNSVVELGQAVDLGMIKEAASIVRPATIVLPDAYLDTERTITQCTRAVDKWYEAIPEASGFLYIPQGTRMEDWIRCAEALSHHHAINFWGIPRNIVKYVGTRAQAIKIAQILNPVRKIHLFGFSDLMFDDVLCARLDGVQGIDSTVPMRAVSLGIGMSLAMQTPPRGDWWETAVHDPMMAYNVGVYRQWIR